MNENITKKMIEKRKEKEISENDFYDFFSSKLLYNHKGFKLLKLALIPTFNNEWIHSIKD